MVYKELERTTSTTDNQSTNTKPYIKTQQYTKSSLLYYIVYG